MSLLDICVQSYTAQAHNKNQFLAGSKLFNHSCE